MELPEAFGKVLKILRKEEGLSQEKLAELADLDRTYISLLERGQRQPTLTVIFSLAQVLKVEPRELISKTEERSKMPLS